MTRFGSSEYFERLDQQVQAHLAPQVVAGALSANQVQEARALAQYRAQKKVRKFYGQTSKYDGQGRLKAN
ncbi:hypothetical protein [Marinobacter sp.]|uniref:hypothetical protein n=1 Tax=Marinobacter sp. TaxID=50741 RepID=UPI003A8EB9DD